MSDLVWSFVTMAVSVAGIYIGGNNPKWNWWYGICFAQPIWAISGMYTGMYFTIVLSGVFVLVYVWNLRRRRGWVWVPESQLRTQPTTCCAHCPQLALAAV